MSRHSSLLALIIPVIVSNGKPCGSNVGFFEFKVQSSMFKVRKRIETLNLER